ncbi:hypothetical protein PMI16_00312 [Herbaspirillum sp. CF444]|uniref:hypothetical protein n=1 Tax=Herbaspirillum sp. CF444 TaxID=1144319 RepID=UPI0002724B71|nr:hypothetical protein [Herbaspirillum sp. CF444]EJL94270.1 hypothetical protein PMI16_00312 [Herbaspirillum sp. CF444]
MKPLSQLPEQHIRSRNSGRLAVREKTMHEVPGCTIASKQFCRRYDLAIDFCENLPVFEFYVIDYISRMMEDADMTARISLSHVSGRCGNAGKILPAGSRIRPVSSRTGLV